MTDRVMRRRYYRRANTCQVCPTYAATLVAVGVPLIVFGVVLALLFMPLANSRMVRRLPIAGWHAATLQPSAFRDHAVL